MKKFIFSLLVLINSYCYANQNLSFVDLNSAWKAKTPSIQLNRNDLSIRYAGDDISRQHFIPVTKTLA